MFKFALYSLKNIKLILLIKLFVSSVFLFMYFVSGRESLYDILHMRFA